MSVEQASPTKCPMCGAILSSPNEPCAACGERLAKEVPIVEPRPLWQKILIVVAILVGVQWALIVLMFAVCLLARY